MPDADERIGPEKGHHFCPEGLIKTGIGKHRQTGARERPEKPLKKTVSLQAIKANKALANIYLVRQPRFSVMPLTKDEFDEILSMSK